MKLQGGYQPNIPGRPSDTVHDVPVPERLCIDMNQHGLIFSPAVSTGESVLFGTPLAWANITGGRIALPAPAGGIVTVSPAAKNRTGTITLNVTDKTVKVLAQPVLPGNATADSLRNALAHSGAWPLIWSHKTGGIPTLDGTDTPARMIVNFAVAEPFKADSLVALQTNRNRFTAGLQFLAGLLASEGTLHLVLPKNATAALTQSLGSETVPGARIQIEIVPLRYPVEHPRVLCRALRLSNRQVKASEGIWVLDVQAVQAIGACLGEGLPLYERFVAVGGPGASTPNHRRVRIGTGLDQMMGAEDLQDTNHILRGGLFQGEPVDPATASVGSADDAFFVIPRPVEREFMGFVNPGFDRVSILSCFATSLTGAADRQLTTSLRGELRPCIACGLCEKVCPVGLMPQVLHRYLYRDAIDEAEQTGLPLCIRCGLCSYVCPSKIELTHQFTEAQERLRLEHEHTAAVKLVHQRLEK